MQLRNRQYEVVRQPNKQRPKRPFHTSFTSFAKLPAELRRMIWRLSLQPRTIEIEERYDEKSYRCSSRTPSVLSVSRDSRAAVIELYPYCFSSRSKVPAIRFNFALDTLFIAGLFDGTALHLLDILTDKELSSIRHVAVDEICGYDDQDDNAQPIFWSNLKKSMDAFTGLEDLLIVLDVFAYTETLPDFQYNDDEFEYLCEFYDEFPQELVQGPNPVAVFQLIDTWTNPKLKLVWGWRRARYPKYT